MAYTDIDFPAEYFNTVLHTGDGASPKSITGFGFNPEFVWVKARSEAYGHSISDIVRGANKTLRSNSTSSEVSDDVFGNLTSFITDGYTATSGATNINYYNQSSTTYVNWGWKANGAGVSNTAGTITSTVSANPTAGFAIATYTGTGAVDTVGHGLTVEPDFIWVKDRDSVVNWICYTKKIDGSNDYLFLNTTDASGNSGFSGATSTVFNFNLGASSYSNTAGRNYIMYSFASVKGYSKIGTYTGNGSADGTFVYTGFKPAFIVYKRTSDTGNWGMLDNTRSTFNLTQAWLASNLSNAETDEPTRAVDFLSNGFKARGTNTDLNSSGSTYIYMAFAENPFVTSTSIPTTAR